MITITFGTWLFPLSVTILAFILFYAFNSQNTNSYAEAMIGGLLALMTFGAATIISLIAWLVWALV